MINLLPESNKKEIRAARMNVVLMRYNVITIVAVVILLVSSAGFYLYLVNAKSNAEQASALNAEKEKQYAETKTQADEYRQNLKIAKDILDGQIEYTSTIIEITKLLPKGVILDNINLTSEDFGNQTVLSARAKDYNTAILLKNAFEAKNNTVFENVFFQTLSQEETSEGENAAYPVVVSISVKIKPEAK